MGSPSRRRPLFPLLRAGSTLLVLWFWLFIFECGVGYVDGKPINWTIPFNDPRVAFWPRDGWEILQTSLPRERYRASAIQGANATFLFRGQTLYYTSPLFYYEASVNIDLNTVVTVLNVTQPDRFSSPLDTPPTTVTTFLVANGLGSGDHRIILTGPDIVGVNATFGTFTYTTDDELGSTESPSPSPERESTGSSNRKLVIPLAVVGSILGALILTILFVWVFKFPQYCCRPARRVIWKLTPNRADDSSFGYTSSSSGGGSKGFVSSIFGGLWGTSSDAGATRSRGTGSGGRYSNSTPRQSRSGGSTSNRDAGGGGTKNWLGSKGNVGPSAWGRSWFSVSQFEREREPTKPRDRDRGDLGITFTRPDSPDGRKTFEMGSTTSHGHNKSRSNDQGLATKSSPHISSTNSAHSPQLSVGSPVKEARQLALDLPYLQYLDALSSPEDGTLKRVLPIPALSDTHLARLNEQNALESHNGSKSLSTLRLAQAQQQQSRDGRSKEVHGGNTSNEGSLRNGDTSKDDHPESNVATAGTQERAGWKISAKNLGLNFPNMFQRTPTTSLQVTVSGDGEPHDGISTRGSSTLLDPSPTLPKKGSWGKANTGAINAFGDGMVIHSQQLPASTTLSPSGMARIQRKPLPMVSAMADDSGRPGTADKGAGLMGPRTSARAAQPRHPQVPSPGHSRHPESGSTIASSEHGLLNSETGHAYGSAPSLGYIQTSGSVQSHSSSVASRPLPVLAPKPTTPRRMHSVSLEKMVDEAVAVSDSGVYGGGYPPSERGHPHPMSEVGHGGTGYHARQTSSSIAHSTETLGTMGSTASRRPLPVPPQSSPPPSHHNSPPSSVNQRQLPPSPPSHITSHPVPSSLPPSPPRPHLPSAPRNPQPLINPTPPANPPYQQLPPSQPYHQPPQPSIPPQPYQQPSVPTSPPVNSLPPTIPQPVFTAPDPSKYHDDPEDSIYADYEGTWPPPSFYNNPSGNSNAIIAELFKNANAPSNADSSSTGAANNAASSSSSRPSTSHTPAQAQAPAPAPAVDDWGRPLNPPSSFNNSAPTHNKTGSGSSTASKNKTYDPVWRPDGFGPRPPSRSGTQDEGNPGVAKYTTGKALSQPGSSFQRGTSAPKPSKPGSKPGGAKKPGNPKLGTGVS